MKLLCAWVLVLCAGWPGATADAGQADMNEDLRESLAQLAGAPNHDAAAGRETHQRLLELYERRSGVLLWSESGVATRAARSAIAALRASPDYGLPAADYVGEALAARLEALAGAPHTPPRQWAQFDVALSTAVLQLLHDLHFGRIDPRTVGFNMPPRREPFDAAIRIEQLARGRDSAAVFADVEPAFLHYRLLQQALSHYRQLADTPGLTALPALGTLRIAAGESYAGAPALRRLLAALGDLPSGESARPATLLDADLALALRRFQFLHGLREDSTLGARTFAALTVPLSLRVRQIELTLERWRWLPPPRAPMIVVNIPQFRLFLFRSLPDREADMLRMNVIVGQEFPRLRTPVFAAELNAIVFRPFWEVPRAITQHELLPQLSRRPDYLRTQNMEIVGSDPEPPTALTPTAPTPTEETLEALAAGRLRLRQRPGRDNALGLIKFALPNPYGVYLHSTPAQRLFAEPRRTFSHGCIRVSDPVSLATELLRSTPGDWTPEHIEAAMNGTATFQVALTQPVRVLILYGTAVATEDGALHFFNDVYGNDRRLEAALHQRARRP